MVSPPFLRLFPVSKHDNSGSLAETSKGMDGEAFSLCRNAGD
jgi:hypothetical protein